MTRVRSNENDAAFGKVRTRTRKRKSLGLVRKSLIGLVVLIVAALIAIPFIASNAGLVTKAVNSFAGLNPLHVEIGDIRVGWFAPLRLEQVRVLDAKGAELALVGEIETQMSLLNLISDYTNLRNIYVRQTRLAIDVQPGTTSLEEALAPLLAKWQTVDLPLEVSNEPIKPITFTGTIELDDATILARDSITGEQWEFSVAEAIVPLPEDFSKTPEISLIGRIAQIDATGNLLLKSTGQFTAKVEPGRSGPASLSSEPKDASSHTHLSLATNGMPLEWMTLVKRRLSWLPIDFISGAATVQVDVDLQAITSLSANITTAQIDHLRIEAPSLLGKSGASMNQVRLVGDVRFFNDALQSDQLQLTSDVGFLRASAKLPWPIQCPTLAKPYIANGNFNAEGEIDLARLLAVAPDIVVLQDQTRLTSGKATLSIRHTSDASNVNAMPAASCDIRLGALKGEIAGKPMQWDDALQLQCKIVPSTSSNFTVAGGPIPEIFVGCKADFCDVQGRGTLTQGQMNAKVDFDKLEKRLSQWIKLPTESLAGNAKAELVWNQQQQDRVAATATIETTALSVVLPQGRLEEPAWQGNAAATFQINGMELVQLDRANATMQSATERLELVIHSPIRLAAMPAGSPQLPPTSINATLLADVAACLNRGRIFSGVDPGIAANGQLNLILNATLDGTQLNVQEANYDLVDLIVQGEGYQVKEPRVQGKFVGNLDSNNIAATRVDQLVVQAQAFALTAKDDVATQAGYSRNGQAAFRIDPSRLMKSIQTTPAANVAADATQYDTSCQGDVTGQLQWLLNDKQVDWQISIDGKDIAVLQTPTQGSSPAALVSTNNTPMAKRVQSVLWQEPQVKADARGAYRFANGSVDVADMSMQSEWMAFAGKLQYESNELETAVRCNGKLTYDMETAVTRMEPFIGTYATVRGQRTDPVEILWRASNTSSASWADALTAKTVIGWDDANIIGIVLGQGSVPVTIEHGVLQTATEIPVSQGTLRWDIQSNLANEPLMVLQRPQMVLDHVAITPQMCQRWLKYVTPLVADVTSVQGQLSLDIEKAEIAPLDYLNQTIAGKLYVHGATIGPGPLADQMIGIVRQIRAMKKGLSIDPSSINEDLWVQMPEQKISFTVEKGMVSHKDVLLKVGDVQMITSGGVALDGRLKMVAKIPIQQAWIGENQYLAPLAGQSLEIPIGGTLQQPKLDASAIGSVTQQLVTAAAQQAVQKQVDRGLNKLLGPLQNQLEPFQQQIQALPNQLPSLPQMQLPQLPQLPNFGFPGFGQQPAAVPPPQ